MDLAEDFLVRFLASFLIWFLFVGLIVLWFIDGKIKKEQVVHALFASLFAWLTAIVIKHFFPTLRPFMANGREIDVLFKPMNGSFPSEHTVIAFALSVTIFMHDKKVGWVFLVSALLIGAARVLANVHYPIDIIGGAFVGTIVAVIVEKLHFLELVNKFYKRRKSNRS
ncbi:MAG TPA: phosphatase PAP2 family protein [Patescibacteria group bacterium]|nr:phosphatase PAP2 family protein [Patescibacteria group bacterium]